MPDTPSKIIRIFRATVEPPMPAPLTFRTPRRPPRVNLRGDLSATIQLENGRKVPAKLHQLSITGGMLEVADYLDERARIKLTIPFASGTVCAKAEMLFPMRGALGYLQPFRITSLCEEQLHLLDTEVTELLKQSTAPAKLAHGRDFRPPFYLETF
jgi:hypothetical protein